MPVDFQEEAPPQIDFQEEPQMPRLTGQYSDFPGPYGIPMQHQEQPLLAVPPAIPKAFIRGQMAVPSIFQALRILPPEKREKAIKGISESAASQVSSLTSPAGLGMAAATVAAPELAIPAMVAYGQTQLPAAIEALQQASGPEETARAVTDVAGIASMILGPVVGAGRKGKITARPKLDFVEEPKPVEAPPQPAAVEAAQPKEPYATETRIIEESRQSEHPGVAPRTAVPAHPEEVRQGEGRPAGRSDSLVGVPEEKKPVVLKPPSPAAEPAGEPPAPKSKEPPVAKSATTAPDAWAVFQNDEPVGHFKNKAQADLFANNITGGEVRPIKISEVSPEEIRAAAVEPGKVIPLPKAEEPAGKEWAAVTPVSGDKVSGRWDVVDASDLVSSSDQGYEQALQPRDRSRQASREQIARISAALQPERLSESATTDLGSPITDDRNQVISGNGRLASIRAAYGAGSERASAYKHFVEQQAEKYGIPAERLAGIKSPVLVRRVTDYGKLSKPEFARLSNEQQVLGMSIAEKASRDASMLRDNQAVMDSFLPSEEGDVLSASNRDFLRAFVQGTGDQAELLNADGSYNSKTLVPRVKNAVLGALLGGEHRVLLNDLIDRAPELGISKASQAVLQAAPKLMKFKGTPYDLGQTLNQALSDLVRIRGKGEKLADFLSQSEMFTDPQRTAESDFLLSRLYEGKSAKEITEGLSRYADSAAKIDVTTPDIFGAPLTPRPELLKKAYERPSEVQLAQEGFTFTKPSPPTAATERATTIAGKGVPEVKPTPASPAEGGKPISPGPGAAATGTPGTGSAIQELGNYVAALPPLKGKQKLSMAEKWADRAAIGKDLGTRISLKAAAITESIKDSMRGVRRPTELGDAVGQLDYLLQRSAGESIVTRRQLEKAVKDPDTRAALWLYADAKGDLAAVRDTLATMPADTKPAVRRALERALNLPPEARAWMPFVEQFYGRKFAEGEAEGVLHDALPDYWTHVWRVKKNMPGAVQAALNSGKISEYFRYARERKLSTMLEGIKNPNLIPGMTLEPVLDAAKIIPHYNYALDRAIASRRFMEKLSGMTASDGRPLVAPSGSAIPAEELKWAVINDETGRADPFVKGIFDTQAEADAAAALKGEGYHVEQRKNEFLMIKSKVKPEELAGYRSIDHPSMRKWQWAGTDETGKTTLYEGELLAHPEAYERLARFMDRSRLTPGKIEAAALRYGGEIKAAKLGLLSTFHQVHVAKHAIFHWTNPFKAGPIDWESPQVRYAIEKGHLKLAPEPGELQQFAEGIMADSAIIHKLPIVGEWSRRYSHYLFTDYIPRLKMATFENALARNREIYGASRGIGGAIKAFGAKPLSEAEIAARVGDSVNAAFGELNKLWLGKVGRDPSFQRKLRLLFLAPDFGEARLRFVGKAFTKYGAEERFALAMNFVTIYALARIGNWLATGDPRGDEPKHWFDVKAGDHWYSMRSVMTDIAHAGARPESFVRVRLNPGLVEPVVEFLTSRDWRGQKRTKGQEVVDFFKRVVPLPFQSMTEDDRHFWEGLTGSMGVQPKRGDAVSEIHERARKYREARGIKEAVEVTESTAGNPYREARLGLEFNEPRRFYRAIQEQYNRLKASNTPDPAKTIENAFKRYYTLPFTGKKTLEEDFKASLAPKDRKLYLEAEQQRAESRKKFYEWWKWHNYIFTGQK